MSLTSSNRKSEVLELNVSWIQGGRTQEKNMSSHIGKKLFLLISVRGWGWRIYTDQDSS